MRVRHHALREARQESLRLPGLRWCDGTYLEDQDFFRLSGMGRDCFLYARDKRQSPTWPDAALSENYTRGRLAVELALPRRPGAARRR